MTMKRYELYSKLTWGLFTVIMPMFLAAVGIVFAYASIQHPSPDAPPLVFVILWLGGLGWAWYRMLQMPYRIETYEDGHIEFVSLIRRAVVSPRDVVSIKPKRLQPGFLVVRHTGGRFFMINQFSGFHEFLTELKRANPA